MDNDEKSDIIKACKIDEPIPPGDPRHFNFDSPTLLLRGQPWRQRVADVIGLASDPTTQIVTGLPGSGKSTELQQLKDDLGKAYHVVLADAGAWVRDDRQITCHDILLALVLALIPDGKPKGATGKAENYFARILNLLRTEIEPTEGEVTAGFGKLKMKLTTNNTLFQEVAQHLGEVQDFRELVFRFLKKEAEKAGRERSDTTKCRLVIILDGIEKRATGDLVGPEEREKYRNHWFGAFLKDARELRPPVHTVYTAPPFMVRRANELGDQFGQELQFLPMVKIFRREVSSTDKRQMLHKEGVRAMQSALFQRIRPQCFSDSTVAAWLVVYSGGYFRDLLRLVLGCIYNAGSDAITEEVAYAAIAQVRQTYLEGLKDRDEGLLKLVHQNRSFRLDETNGPQVDSLLQGHLMLRYHDPIPWYGVHPLLWDRLKIEGPTEDEVKSACK